MDSFGFGQVMNGTQSFESILNSDVVEDYSSDANQTIITPSFRGLGLPATQYRKFTNLLSIASNGGSNCDGSFKCVLSQSCSAYPDLWDLQFQLSFANQVVLNTTNTTTLSGDDKNSTNTTNTTTANMPRTMYVPLATFANTNTTSGMCEIYVEKLEQGNIVLGSLFFQSFYYQFIGDSAND